jgi:arsenite-transporting ATPase
MRAASSCSDVVLPPVLEAANLQADLRRAGIEPWAWIVNNSLAAAGPHSSLLRQRAQRVARD